MTLSSKALHVNLERLFNFKMLMSDITGTCFIVPTLLANISISKMHGMTHTKQVPVRLIVRMLFCCSFFVQVCENSMIFTAGC